MTIKTVGIVGAGTLGNGIAQVFAQAALGFALASADPRFVGVNLVAPEDDPVALRDFELHMRIFQYFHRKYPKVKISLHAGGPAW